jgi:hypothetical protein
MITSQQYFGPWMFHPDATPERMINANELLLQVERLTNRLELQGTTFRTNPKTKTWVSGTTFGGFRPQDCPQGTPGSSHKQGQGVDIYDPLDEIDGAITDDLLEELDLYREHPDATPGWCHLTTRPPSSKKRTFLP